MTAEFLPLDRIREICRRHAVRELLLFGSALTNSMRPDSDVDLLVEFEDDAQPITFDGYFALKEEQEAAVGRPVDLVRKRPLKWLVRDRVLAEARPVCTL